MSNRGLRLKPKLKHRSEHRLRRYRRQRAYVNGLAVLLVGVSVVVALINSIASRPADWTEPCSDYEIRQGMARDRFDSIHAALTQGQFSQVDLRKLRQAIWQDLPLCRELVAFASLSLQLYNDLLFAEAAPDLSDNLPDLKDYERWYELFLRLHRK